MAGATPFLEGLLTAAERAGTRLPDLKVFICGGASVSAVADPQGGSVFRPRRGHPRVRFDRGARHHHRVADTTPSTRQTPTDARGSPTSNWSTARSARADRRCWSAICIPKTTPTSFDEDGYFRTGDLGRWIDDEYLVVTGRAKDIIIRNGENISPKEVEDILVGHPGIAEVAVVGVPDERTGERACAVIVAPASDAPDLADLRGPADGPRAGQVQNP